MDTVDTSHVAAPAKMELAREGGTPSKPTPTSADGTAAPKAATTTSAAETETKKENKAQQPSLMGQLAAEAAAKAKQAAKKVPTPLASKTNTASSTSKDKEESKEKDTPLSPSGVPLPNSPAVKSPTTIDSAIKSPTSPTSAKSPSTSHHRHSSTGSAHSFIPEKSEPEVREHRGSSLSVASQEEIKKIESECSIAEEDEEELDEEAEDAILFGDGDVEEKEKEIQKTEEKTNVKKPRGLSFSGPTLTPVTEEKPSDAVDETSKPIPIHTKGGPEKGQEIMKSAGLTPKSPEKAVESGEVDDSDEDNEESEEDEVDKKVTTGVEKATASSSASAKDSLASSKTAPAGTEPASDSTTPADTKLAKAVDKVKIQDQEPAEAKQAGDSVED